MSKQDYRKARKKAYELPRLAVGDVLLVGKFKNRKATITGFSSDENNQPVAQTDKGDQSDDTCTRKRRQSNEFDYDSRRHADLLQGLGRRRTRRVQPWLATKMPIVGRLRCSSWRPTAIARSGPQFLRECAFQAAFLLPVGNLPNC